MQNLSVVVKNINFFYKSAEGFKITLPVGFCGFTAAKKVFSVK